MKLIRIAAPAVAALALGLAGVTPALAATGSGTPTLSVTEDCSSGSTVYTVNATVTGYSPDDLYAIGYSDPGVPYPDFPTVGNFGSDVGVAVTTPVDLWSWSTSTPPTGIVFILWTNEDGQPWLTTLGQTVLDYPGGYPAACPAPTPTPTAAPTPTPAPTATPATATPTGSPTDTSAPTDTPIGDSSDAHPAAQPQGRGSVTSAATPAAGTSPIPSDAPQMTSDASQVTSPVIATTAAPKPPTGGGPGGMEIVLIVAGLSALAGGSFAGARLRPGRS
jgi:hypothetical protein